MRYREIIENMDHDKDGRAVEELRAALEAHKDRLQSASDDEVYDIIDKIMTRIAKSHSISGQKLHDMWVDKYKQIPDTWIMKEGLDEAVGGNYLYHATDAAGIKGMLSSGTIRSATGPQAATQAQTRLPTVSLTRDWGYASGVSAGNQLGGIGRDAVIVLDRNIIERHFKTLATSQSTLIKGQAFNPYLKKDGQARSQNTDPLARTNAINKAKFAEPTAKAGGEFEEAVVVPKGSLPLNGTMVGFWINPKSKLLNDPEIMNDPRRLEMTGPHRFTKAAQQQAMAENNTAAGINKMFNNLGDPVFANLQRVALLAMQGRQSEAASRLHTVIKDADPAVQKKITDAVNNIKPVTINGRVADSSTLDKSKQHNDWIINTFIPWVQSLLGQTVAENFHDGRNPQDKGDSKRYGVPTKASISTLRKVAKQGGRKGQLAHWMANMKSGRAKAKRK